MAYLEIATRCLIGVVFLASSASKLAGRAAFDAFVASLHEMRPVPPNLTGPVARLVVGSEVAVWVLLALPTRWTGLVGLGVAGALLVAFAVAVGRSVRQGVNQPCRCFGLSAVPLGRRHVVRNIVLAAAAATGAVAVAESGSARPDWLLVAGLGGLLAGGLVVVLDDVLELFRPVNAGPDPVRGRR